MARQFKRLLFQTQAEPGLENSRMLYAQNVIYFCPTELQRQLLVTSRIWVFKRRYKNETFQQ
jgi:hypothetical protein